MNRQSQWLFEAPSQATEALFEMDELTREKMAAFLRNKWQQTPLLQELAAIQRLRGAALQRALVNVLSKFERQTGVTLQVVPAGAVQRLRGRGNEASLRSRPGFLQIEQPVFRDSQKLLVEVQHELAFYFAGGLTGVPRLQTNPIFNGLNLLEMMIQANGRLPPPVAP